MISPSHINAAISFSKCLFVKRGVILKSYQRDDNFMCG